MATTSHYTNSSHHLDTASTVFSVTELNDDVRVQAHAVNHSFDKDGDHQMALTVVSLVLNPKQAGELFNALFNFLSPYDVTPKFDEVNA